MFSMLVGSLLFTLVFGIVLTVFTQISASDVQHIVWRRQLDAYMNHKKIPKRLRRRVRDFVDRLKEKRAFDEGLLLSGLSRTLRTEISVYNCRKLIRQVWLRRSSGAAGSRRTGAHVFPGRGRLPAVACDCSKDGVPRAGTGCTSPRRR